MDQFKKLVDEVQVMEEVKSNRVEEPLDSRKLFASTCYRTIVPSHRMYILVSSCRHRFHLEPANEN